MVGTASASGATVAGQNADLPAMYRDRLVLVRRQPSDGQPHLATLTPAGQIGYHRMNEAGVAVFANFLYSGGWRVGVPRYLLTRIALGERSRGAALEAIEQTTRAISPSARPTWRPTTPTTSPVDRLSPRKLQLRWRIAVGWRSTNSAVSTC